MNTSLFTFCMAAYAAVCLNIAADTVGSPYYPEGVAELIAALSDEKTGTVSVSADGSAGSTTWYTNLVTAWFAADDNDVLLVWEDITVDDSRRLRKSWPAYVQTNMVFSGVASGERSRVTITAVDDFTDAGHKAFLQVSGRGNVYCNFNLVHEMDAVDVNGYRYALYLENGQDAYNLGLYTTGNYKEDNEAGGYKTFVAVKNNNIVSNITVGCFMDNPDYYPWVRFAAFHGTTNTILIDVNFVGNYAYGFDPGGTGTAEFINCKANSSAGLFGKTSLITRQEADETTLAAYTNQFDSFGEYALSLSPPTGLAATPSSGSVSLDWNDSTDSNQTYNVYRSITSGSYSNALASNLMSSAYVDTTVIDGTIYYYVVTAVNTHGIESGQSREVSVTLADITPPAAPTGLEATAGDGSVLLNWADNGDGDIAFYSVYRSIVAGGYESALVTDLSLSSYMDNTVVNGTTYYYVVKASDASGNESPRSTEVSTVSSFGLVKGYDLWASGHGVGAGTNDYDADGLSNFAEYALRGDPANGQHRGTLPIFSKHGSRYIYVHPQRADDPSLVYIVETATNLTSGSWTSGGYTVIGTNITGESLDFVTNEVETVDSEKFVRLKIEQ